MDEYAYVNGKKLRKGFTTGTCATAATVAALSMILNQEREEKVTVHTASGVEVTMDVHNPSFGPEEATAAIEKDGLVETISSELVGLSLFPLGVILLLSSKPGMI